jgi:hypothetical protein
MPSQAKPGPTRPDSRRRSTVVSSLPASFPQVRSWQPGCRRLQDLLPQYPPACHRLLGVPSCCLFPKIRQRLGIEIAQCYKRLERLGQEPGHRGRVPAARDAPLFEMPEGLPQSGRRVPLSCLPQTRDGTRLGRADVAEAGPLLANPSALNRAHPASEWP